ncbi:hypothetical protein BVX98_01195 [bacterium F11]|nr:hypothetical protein BVX98_01195 [bacterium F11]
MPNSPNQKLIDQLRQVFKDAIDYFQSVVLLLQARFTEMALSSVVFVALLILAGILGLASFLLFNIALGVWITHLTGGAGWSILILGTFYGILAYVSGSFAMKWLNRLKS